jgi:general stress protein YciG
MSENKQSGTSNRGFASMDPAKQRAIASKGGSSVPPEKRPFAQNHKLAAEAGRKGGENSHGGRKARETPAATGTTETA